MKANRPVLAWLTDATEIARTDTEKLVTALDRLIQQSE